MAKKSQQTAPKDKDADMIQPPPPKPPEKDLFGKDVNEVEGKLLSETPVKVTVKKTLASVRVYRKNSNDGFIFVWGKTQGEGTTMEEAMRDFKKAYREAQ